MSLVIILPTDVFLLLLSAKYLVEIQRVPENEIRHFVEKIHSVNTQNITAGRDTGQTLVSSEYLPHI